MLLTCVFLFTLGFIYTSLILLLVLIITRITFLTANTVRIKFLLITPVVVVLLTLTLTYLFLFFKSSCFCLPLLNLPLNEVDSILYWPFIYIFTLITLLTLVYSFAYNTKELLNFKSYIWLILVAGGFFFAVNSLFIFFLAYEALLLPSFLILYNFAKTRKAVEAAFLMFFWTQFGAIFLIINFQYLFFITGSTSLTYNSMFLFSNQEAYFLFWTLLVGFGVKFPIWPFYDWLPKAHVEAPTNFSIFLSGVLVKFAFFGFVKYLTILNLDITPLTVYVFLLVGFLDSSSKIYYQTDLKKLIAYSTVIEMHWLVVAVVSGSNFFWLAGFAMMIAHALVSANFFLLVDSVTRRFKTRLTTEISGLFYTTPNLYFVTLIMLIVFLGFPGSLLFVSEILFFSALLDLSFFIFIFLFFIAYFFVPSCFFKSWFLVLFNFKLFPKYNPAADLSLFEGFLIMAIILLLFWFGYSFQFFF